jgi:hypothetical protein
LGQSEPWKRCSKAATIRYAKALQRIIEELKVRQLISLLEQILNPPAPPANPHGTNRSISAAEKNEFSTLLFTSRAGYERLMEDATTAKVVRSLEIGEIYDPPRLGVLVRIIFMYQSTAQLIQAVPDVMEVFSFYTLLKNLARLEHSCTLLLEEEKLGIVSHPRDDTVDFQLIDTDGQGIDPLRLSEFIRIILQLHTDFARIFQVTDDKVRFVYFDSGSDLLVRIQCAKVIIDAIKTLVGEWWERIKFRRHKEYGQDMDALSKGLTLMGQIQDSVNNNVIDEDTSRILKTRVLMGVDNLIGIGATLPIHQEPENIDMRQILIEKGQTKLLGTGTATEGHDREPEKFDQR